MRNQGRCCSILFSFHCRQIQSFIFFFLHLFLVSVYRCWTYSFTYSHLTSNNSAHHCHTSRLILSLALKQRIRLILLSFTRNSTQNGELLIPLLFATCGSHNCLAKSRHDTTYALYVDCQYGHKLLACLIADHPLSLWIWDLCIVLYVVLFSFALILISVGLTMLALINHSLAFIFSWLFLWSPDKPSNKTSCPIQLRKPGTMPLFLR